MDGVAADANVTERTVYRHFESLETLLRAVWQRYAQRSGSELLPLPVEEVYLKPRRLFQHFDQSREFARSTVYSRFALEARASRNNIRQQRLLRPVREALPEFEDVSLRRRAAIVDLLSSPNAWEFLEQLWGFDGVEAGIAAGESIEVLLDLRRADWD